jgi:hypothetical protein
VSDVPVVFLEDAEGIHLECHQAHKPFSISMNLLIYVHMLFLIRVEEGLNTSTIALRVVGGNRKGTKSLGYKYGDVALQVVGVSNLRQLNVVMSPPGI